jgi:hypothetical protein
VVPAESPLMLCANATLLLPAPSALPPLTGAREPNVSLHDPGLVVL